MECIEQNGQDKMDWTREAIMEFLDCYENEPVIWNGGHPNHKSKKEALQAWKRIEQRMGSRYTLTDLKRKKDSLLAQFRTLLHKVLETKRNGEEVYKPTWFAFERMANFLLVKDPKKEAIVNELEGTLFGDLREDIIIPDHTYCETETLKTENCDAEQIQPSSALEAALTAPFVIKRRASRTETTEDVNSKETTAKRRKTQTTPSTSSTLPHPTVLKPNTQISSQGKDVCDLFGELVAIRLKSMDEHCKEICMHGISNILYETRMQCLKRKDHPQLYPVQILSVTTTPPKPSSEASQIVEVEDYESASVGSNQGLSRDNSKSPSHHL